MRLFGVGVALALALLAGVHQATAQPAQTVPPSAVPAPGGGPPTPTTTPATTPAGTPTTAPTTTPAGTPTTTLAGTPAGSASADSGAAIYASDCAFCHGPDGKGSFQGPDITQAGTAAVDFQVSTRRMPLHYPYNRARPTYTPEEIQSLVEYTSSFVHGPAVPSVDISTADVAKGGELYRTNCASCHQMVGSGGILAYDVEVPSLRKSTPRQVVEAMRTGPGQMPLFEQAAFSDEDARDIAAYVDYLHHPEDRGGLGLGHFGPVPEGAVAIIIGLGSIVLITRLLGTRSRPGAH